MTQIGWAEETVKSKREVQQILKSVYRRVCDANGPFFLSRNFTISQSILASKNCEYDSRLADSPTSDLCPAFSNRNIEMGVAKFSRLQPES